MNALQSLLTRGRVSDAAVRRLVQDQAVRRLLPYPPPRGGARAQRGNAYDDTAEALAVTLVDPAGSDAMVAAAATLDETLARFLRSAAVLYAFDGADPSRLLAESAANPNLRVALYDAATKLGNAVTPADGQALAAALRVAGVPMGYNGVTLDMTRIGNTETLLANAARTANVDTAVLNLRNFQGVVLSCRVATAGTSTLRIRVMLRDTDQATSHFFIDGAAFAAVTTDYTRTFVIYPGAVETAVQADMEVFGTPPPASFMVRMEKGDASSWTFNLQAHWIN